MALPFEDTKVTVDRSISQIIGYLGEIGFDDVMQRIQGGQFSIYAKKDEAVFSFKPDVQATIDALIKDKGERTQRHIRQKTHEGKTVLENIQKKARKIAWRVIAEKVKADRDAVLYRTLEIGESFGGFLVMPDPAGGTTTMGKQITAAVAAGKLRPQNLLIPFLNE